MKKLLLLSLLLVPFIFGAELRKNPFYKKPVAAGGGAIALDTTTTYKSNSGSTPSFSHTCTGSDRALVVTIAGVNGFSVTSVTYNGVAMTQLWYNASSGVASSAAFILANPDTGSNTVAITFAASEAVYFTASSWTGVDQTTPNRTVTTANNAFATASNAVSGDIIVDGVATYQSTNISEGANQTLIGVDQNIGLTTAQGGSSYVDADTDTSPTWTTSASLYTHGVIPLIPSS